MDIIDQKVRGQVLGHILRKQAVLWETTDFENFEHNCDFIEFDLELEKLVAEYNHYEKENNVYALLDYCKEEGINIAIRFDFSKNNQEIISEVEYYDSLVQEQISS